MIWHNCFEAKNPAHPAVSLFRATGQNTNRESRSQQVGSYLIMHKSFFARGPSKVAEFHRECGMWKTHGTQQDQFLHLGSPKPRPDASSCCNCNLYLRSLLQSLGCMRIGNCLFFSMWAHQKGPIWLDARAPALEFSGYCFWSWHQLWGSCEGGEAAVQVLKDVLQCLTSLRMNMYMLHLVSMILSSLHPFKLQEVATIPCQLPTPAPTFSVQVHVFASIAMWLLAAAPCWHLSPDMKVWTLSRSPKLLGHFLIIHTFKLG